MVFVRRYRKRISGPFMDRTELHLDVMRVIRVAYCHNHEVHQQRTSASLAGSLPLEDDLVYRIFLKPTRENNSPIAKIPTPR